MPIFKNHITFSITRNIKVFLSLEASVTHACISSPQEVHHQERKPEYTRQHIENRDKTLARSQADPNQVKSTARSLSPGDSIPKFFLVGRAKSGTSWLMTLLNSHPEIFCRGEGKFFGKDSPRSLYGALNSSKELQTWLNNNPWTYRDQDPDLQDIIRNIVNYLMEEKLIRWARQKRIVGDKTPLLNAEVIEEIVSICPSSKVIHIVRDGRDVAVSTIHHRWNTAKDNGVPFKLTAEEKEKRQAYRSDPEAFRISGESIFGEGNTSIRTIAKEWGAKMSRVMHDGAAMLDDNYYQVRYEDLLAEPVGELQPLLEFLTADFSEEIAKKCVEAATFEQLSGRNRGNEDSTSFYRKGVAGDWKSVFTEEDKRAFKEEAGDLLIQLGYEKDYNW